MPRSLKSGRKPYGNGAGPHQSGPAQKRPCTRTALHTNGPTPHRRTRAVLRATVNRIFTLMAGSQGRTRESIMRDYAEHDPRASRYWELVSVINGTPWPSALTLAHSWMAAAAAYHLR